MSTTRLIASSTRPPKYPAIDPSMMPITDDTPTTTIPTSSEIRAPDRTRAKMSRPSSSGPNQCRPVGPSSRRASSCAAGSNGESQGPKTAANAAMTTMAAPNLLISNSRVEHAVHKIREEVHGDVRHRDEQNASLHDRIVAEPDRLNEQPANAGPREDRFGDDRAG